jgi:hypothetical protein
MAMRMHLRANGCRSDVIVHAAANSTVQGQLRRSPQLELRVGGCGIAGLVSTAIGYGCMIFLLYVCGLAAACATREV